MSAASSPILIAGGGIGGLCAALTLARMGYSCRIFERDITGEQAGAGIQLGPNGTAILARLGLSAALEAVASRPECVEIIDGVTGKRLNTIALGDIAEERYGAPYYTLHRADLHRILKNAVAAEPLIMLETGFQVLSARQDDSGAICLAADGREARGAALIGADGAGSALRKMIAFDVALKSSGEYAWRQLSPGNDLPDFFRDNAVRLWMHPGEHVVHYPVAQGALVNIVAITRDGIAPPQFLGWHRDVRETLSRLQGWVCWPVLDMPASPRWSSGRMTLLGDAAHLIPPFLASGAVLAIEDAAVLGKAIAQHPHNLAEAFTTYEAARRSRVAQVNEQSRRMGEIYHMTGFMRLARNAVLSRIPQRALLARSDWLYRF